jgi:hypothetical protein
MASAESIVTYILFFVGIMITLLIPIPIAEEYRLFTITAITFIFLVIILSKFEKSLNKNQKVLEEWFVLDFWIPKTKLHHK